MVGDNKKKNRDVGSGSGSSKTPVNDPTSPYFFISADHTRICITPVVLKGDNYDEWAKAVRNVFRAKKKLGFIDGLITQPKEEGFELDDWCVVNLTLVAWVFNAIDPPLHSMISYMKTVKELWEDFQEQFSIGNDMRIHQLKNELASCKQGGQTVAAYYSKLKSTWEELSSYIKSLICICAGCTYGAVKELVQEREKEKVHQFLMGLDDEVLGTTVSNILSTKLLPTLNRVYAMIIQEGRNRNIARANEERANVVAFVVQFLSHARNNYNGGPSNYSDKLRCAHCEQLNLEEKKLFLVDRIS